MKKNIFALHLTGLIIIFLFGCQSVLAQPGIVRGWVKDEKGNPLTGASVTIGEKQIGTAADRKGHFKLKVSPGKYNIRVSFVDHSAMEESITIRAGEIVEENFTIAKVYKECQEVVVQCSHSKQSLINTGAIPIKDSVINDHTANPVIENEKSTLNEGDIGIRYDPSFTASFIDFNSGKNVYWIRPHINVSSLGINRRWSSDQDTRSTLHFLRQFIKR